MNAYPRVTHSAKMADSICHLITVLIRTFPESDTEEFDQDAFLTVLEKLQLEAEILRAAIDAENHK
jgi:hypothetical protein